MSDSAHTHCYPLPATHTYRLGYFMAMGVGAGANILTRYAVSSPKVCTFGNVNLPYTLALHYLVLLFVWGITQKV